MAQGQFEEVQDLIDAGGVFAGETVGIDAVAVILEGFAEIVHECSAVLRGNRRLVQRFRMAGENHEDSLGPCYHFGRNVHGLRSHRAQKIKKEGDMPADIGESHNGNARAGQGIVGVIPFGALGVHPDSTTGNEVAYFSKQRDKEFFQERGEVDVTLVVEKEPAISAHELDAGIDFRGFGGVKSNRLCADCGSSRDKNPAGRERWRS